MNQQNTPLFNALSNHSKRLTISMHVPGHKYGQNFPSFGLDYYEKLLQIDATEISGLDDLHDPEGVILEAEQLTANLYGVERSYFLVNGSTVGNLAMILSVCSQNDIVLVQRNSHKSILNGLKLSGARPIFLSPEFDDEAQVASFVSYDTVKRALSEYPNAKAIILTSPNYYGMSNPSELAGIIELAHLHKIPVLIDEAHGAHFIVDGFPPSVITLGADIVVQSAHKTLPAMTMGSYLHWNSKLLSKESVEVYLRMLQSSSPSYPIMASLDLARYHLANYKKEGTTQIIEKILRFKEELLKIPQITVIESQKTGVHTDSLKITIQSQCKYNGYQLQSLFEEVGVFTELADPNNVLFVLPLTEAVDYEEVVNKIKGQLQGFKVEKKRFRQQTNLSEKITTLPIFYNEIKGYNKKVVSFKQAVGKISGEMIVPYPPGIPILMEGERITEGHIELLSTYIDSGARFQGGDMESRLITILE
ncbi:aminotransferase class I/II-fold pyridoxal phosphate-dependent enzyme [Fredinandcohnia sp. 179-A 10B2 NHS]|uniref:aminotransferase class I/II-fold pyridoxal phosphate-dependent enzyme n=1 Tax=Fredinandcohnia sp. 179-A 10B2 NHS TaxID=3235176 RepID=UPI0039A27B11